MKIKELRRDFIDDSNILHIDAYFIDDDHEEGITVVKIDLTKKKVIFWTEAFQQNSQVKKLVNAILLEYRDILPSFVTCSVKSHYTVYIVKFKNGKNLLLQSDYDQHSFAKDCGLLDGASKIEDLVDVDLTDIQQCPDDYLNTAENSD